MKRLIAIALSVVFVLTLSACNAEPVPPVSSGEDPSEDEILLTFEGASVQNLTRAEFLALEPLTVELTRTNSKGETTTGTYTGVHWGTLAEAIGALDAKSVELEASDGYVQAYNLETLNAKTSVFALYKDGEPITEEEHNGQVWFCASEDYTANYWAKFVVKITVK